MKWSNSLCFKYLNENRKRTIVTVIGIMISSALICGVMTIMSSYKNMEINEAIRRNGNIHATFKNVGVEKKEYLTKDNRVDDYVIMNEIGDYQIQGSENISGSISGYEKKAFNIMPVKLINGRYPTKNSEIVVSEDLIKESNNKYKVGDEIDLNIGYKGSNNEVNEEKEFIVDGVKKFTIVGVCKEDYKINNKVITYTDLQELQQRDKVNIAVRFNDIKDIHEFTKEIADKLGMLKTNDIYDIEYNEDLLRLYGESKYDDINSSITTILAIVILLVISITVVTIYNSFNISILERKRQFGMMSSLGATERQIQLLIIKESMILGIIAIPFGVLLGTLGVKALFSIIIGIFNSNTLKEMQVEVIFNLRGIMISVIISLITIYLSALLPAIKAGRISPIDAIRNSGDFSKGKIRKNRIIKKIFGIEGELAYINLKRNRKKYRITLFSLIVSVTMFIAFSGYVSLFSKTTDMINEFPSEDFIISSKNKIASIPSELPNEIKDLPGIKSVINSNFFMTTANIKEENINKKLPEEIRNPIIEGENLLDNYACIVNSIGNENLKNIKLEEGKFNIEEAKKKNGVILLNNNRFVYDGKMLEMPVTNFKIGDKINIHDYTSNGDIDQEFEVMAICNEIIPGVNRPGNNISLITLDEIVRNIRVGKEFNITGQASIYIYANDVKTVRTELSKYMESNNKVNELKLSLYDVEAENLEQANLQKIIITFVYSFIILISAISVLNIVNTINTNISLRKSEFATIESMGITPFGLKKIIYLESIYYSLFAVIYGVPIGIGLTYLVYRPLYDVVGFQFQFPYVAILIVIIGLIIVSLSAAYVPIKKLEKESIVENIRGENI